MTVIHLSAVAPPADKNVLKVILEMLVGRLFCKSNFLHALKSMMAFFSSGSSGKSILGASGFSLMASYTLKMGYAVITLRYCSIANVHEKGTSKKGAAQRKVS